jgi:hypothetical protein
MLRPWRRQERGAGAEIHRPRHHGRAVHAVRGEGAGVLSEREGDVLEVCVLSDAEGGEEGGVCAAWVGGVGGGFEV